MTSPCLFHEVVNRWKRNRVFAVLAVSDRTFSVSSAVRFPPPPPPPPPPRLLLVECFRKPLMSSPSFCFSNKFSTLLESSTIRKFTRETCFCVTGKVGYLLTGWYQRGSVQCCFTSTETIRTIRDGEPRTVTSTFTQFLSSVSKRQYPVIISRRHESSALWSLRYNSGSGVVCLPLTPRGIYTNK